MLSESAGLKDSSPNRADQAANGSRRDESAVAPEFPPGAAATVPSSATGSASDWQLTSAAEGVDAIRHALTREERVELAVAQYLEAVELGSPPSPVEFLDRFPDLRQELAEFLDDWSAFRTSVRPLYDATSFVVEPPSDPLRTRIGEFEILREIGRGGMGIVYEAHQTTLSRRVALKVLNPAVAISPIGVQRFRREAEAAAKLRHPHIVPVYSSGQAGGVIYYAMELVDGPSLDKVVAELRKRPPAARGRAFGLGHRSDSNLASGPASPAAPGVRGHSSSATADGRRAGQATGLVHPSNPADLDSSSRDGTQSLLGSSETGGGKPVPRWAFDKLSAIGPLAPLPALAVPLPAGSAMGGSAPGGSAPSEETAASERSADNSDATVIGSLDVPSSNHVRSMFQGTDDNGADPSDESHHSDSWIRLSRDQYYETIARLIADIASALDHAHAHGVIHRDVKPSNLLLSPDGRLAINDFGLARVLEEPEMTATGELVGSPAYMSPEQVASDRDQLDHRTDIYSLGATIYELLTLQAPFRGRTRDQILHQIVHAEPVPPRQLVPAIPRDLETICLKCLDKNPAGRYQTAADLAEDLRRFVRREPIVARHVSMVGQSLRWVRRYPGWFTALSVLLLAVLMACTFGYQAWSARLAQLRDTLDDAYAAAMGGDLEQAELEIGRAQKLGATAVEISMVRGQLALYRGEYDDAVAQLERAVERDPASVAARSMLAAAYVGAGQWEDYERSASDLLSRTPVTPDDYLFKGLASSYLDPREGLRLLDTAVQRKRNSTRNSPIAHMIRAEVRAHLARDTGETEDAELALEDLDEIPRWLRDENPAMIMVSLFAHQVAASAYHRAGDIQRFQESTEAAGKDVEKLAPFDHLPTVVENRSLHFLSVDEPREAFRVLERAYQKRTLGVSYYYALSLFRRGEPKAALDVLTKKSERSSNEEFLRVVLLKELRSKESPLAAYRELEGRYESGVTAVFLPGLLLALGEVDLAKREALELRKQTDKLPRFRREFYHRLLGFIAGTMTAGELLESTQRSQWDQCEANFFVGLRSFAVGDLEGSREHFQRAIATRCYGFMSWDWSFAFLERLDDEPEWPSWIKMPRPSE